MRTIEYKPYQHELKDNIKSLGFDTKEQILDLIDKEMISFIKDKSKDKTETEEVSVEGMENSQIIEWVSELYLKDNMRRRAFVAVFLQRFCLQKEKENHLMKQSMGLAEELANDDSVPVDVKLKIARYMMKDLLNLLGLKGGVGDV